VTEPSTQSTILLLTSRWLYLFACILSAPIACASVHRVRYRHVSEYTLQAVPRRKPGLLSLAKGDAVELALEIYRDGIEKIEGGSARRVCIGLTYLRSYEGMAAASVNCSGRCSCRLGSVLDGRWPASKSLFHTSEIEVAAVGRWRHGSGRATQRGLTSDDHEWCRLSLTNVGAGGAVMPTSSHHAKFRLSGLYVREPAPRCEAHIGTRREDAWWRSFVNRIPQNSGMEPF